VCYFVADEGRRGADQRPAEIVGASRRGEGPGRAAYKTRSIAKLSVPSGIISGLAGGLYNRYSRHQAAELPRVLRRRRFVPIAAGGAGLASPSCSAGVAAARARHGRGRARRDRSGESGLFVYGVLNRCSS
jgi:PTS system N-acetylglucosamine-specific IIC component